MRRFRKNRNKVLDEPSNDDFVMVSGRGLGIGAMAAMECYDTDQVLLCPSSNGKSPFLMGKSTINGHFPLLC